MQTIAIVGAGFTGLAVAWEFLERKTEVHLYDPAGIGGGASGIAAGLMHPYAGAHAKLNWMGKEGYEATCILLEVASQTLNQSVAEKSGMLRIALTDKVERDYRRCAEKYSDVIWLEAEECQRQAPGIVKCPGIWISSALTVNSSLYLEGLWKACQKRGAQLFLERIESLASLNRYDLIVIATGAALLPELHSLPITPVKGQILEMGWQKLPIPINTQAYILPQKESCIVGATYERGFSSPLPDADFAMRELMPKAYALLPSLQNATLIHCRAGVRASAPHHRPLLKQWDAKTWILTGMGSKGLLYHALFAKRLIAAVNSSWL